MTGHEDDFLVRVRAQVMTRDESTEGWLPMSGGGLAHVSIRKRTKLPPDASGHEYIIFGQRISDQTVILSCAINRDLQYFKVMPTFHHWRAGKQRNGLTFQTAADARAFDKGIVKAYDDLLSDGVDEKKAGSWDKYDSLVGEDDVFMTLDLPRETSESRCGSEGSGSQKSDKQHPFNITYISPPQPASVTEAVAAAMGSRSSTPLAISPTSLSRRHSPPSGTVSSSSPSPPLHSSSQHPASQYAHQHHHHHHHHHHQTTTSVVTHQQHQPPSATITGKIATISSSTPSALIPPPPSAGGGGGGVMDVSGPGQIAPGDNYSYVQLTTTVHDSDPPLIRATARRDSTSSLKKRAAAAATAADSPLGMGGTTVMKTRLRCRYCQEFYTEEWNKRGACEHAPDCFRTMIDRIPGMPCARGLVYHCMSDAEGDTVAHPCDCVATVDGSCTKRWFGLALLSLLMPCLWCYPPLKACHVVGVSCGMCGGKHKPYI